MKVIAGWLFCAGAGMFRPKSSTTSSGVVAVRMVFVGGRHAALVDAELHLTALLSALL